MGKVKNPIIFIFITVLIDCIGIRIIYPVAATIISEVTHVTINQAVIYSGWMMSAYAVMQLIFSPVLGGLSDQYGRRLVLLISLFGLGLGYLFLALANTLTLLFVGRIIAGICGSSITTGFAYVADISEIGERAKNFGWIGAAVGLGFIIGPFIGGLFSEIGIRAPFIASACLAFINGIYGYVVLPESLSIKNRRPFSLKRSNPFGAFVHVYRNKEIRVLLFIIFLLFFAAQALPSVWPFYTKYTFKWSDLEIGYSLAFVGLMVAIVKGGLVNWFQVQFGSLKSVYLGLGFNSIGLILFAFAYQSWMIYAFTFLYCVGGIASPILQGIISGKMPANEQGELQAIITSLMSLSNILAPLLMTNLFYFFTQPDCRIHFPGAPFITAAGIIFIAFMLSIYKLKSKPKEI